MFSLSSLLLSFSMDDLKTGLWVMLFGLLGVFTVIIFLYLFTKLLGSFSGKSGSDKK